jgi:hypothetical protein
MTMTRRTLVGGGVAVLGGLTASRSLAQGTPVGDGDASRLASLLAMIPGSMAAQAVESGLAFTYADVTTQLETVGIEGFEAGSGEVPDGYVQATNVLAIAAQAYSFALEPAFITTFGFSPLSAQEVLTIGAPPHELTVFRGGLPVADLPAAWEASGFARETTADGIDIWTAGKEGELDLTSAVSQYGLGGLNNVAIFDDVVVFGRFFTDIEAVAAHNAGGGESFIDEADYATLIGSLYPETVSALGLNGSLLDLRSLLIAGDPGMTVSEIEETSPIPEYDQALFAITAGAVGEDFTPTGEGTAAAAPIDDGAVADAIVQVRLRFASEDDAVSAIASIETRWNSMTSIVSARPYTDVMTIVAAQPDPADGAIAAIDFRPIEHPAVWYNLVLQRDLLPFAWIGEAPVEATPTAAG